MRTNLGRLEIICNERSVLIKTQVYTEENSLNIELPEGLIVENNKEVIIDEVKSTIRDFCYDSGIQYTEIFLVKYFFIVKGAVYKRIQSIFPEMYI